jgi:hypothetical protein
VLDLSSINAKIDRGYEHLDALDTEIQTWLRRHPYGLRTKVEDEGRRHVGFLEIYGEPDSARLGVLIGDCAHNFRAALDHLVVAVVRDNVSAARFAECEGALQYPICTTKKAWGQAIAQHRLESTSRRVCAKIQRSQPYRTGDPPAHSLAILSWLDNGDKHRLVHAVAAYPSIRTVNLTPPVRATSVQFGVGPYENGAQIYDISIDPPTPDVEVSSDLGVEIQVRDAPRAEDIRVVLTKIGGAVQGIAADVAKVHATDQGDHEASSS